MKVEVIAIGDELLIGQTINTNAAWIGSQMAQLGAAVEYCSVIKDEEQSMLNAFAIAMSRVDVVIVTGGLGPTKDDITKKVLCKFFDTKLVLNQSVLKHVKSFFENRKTPMLDVNIHQAELPESCEVLTNKLGTAAGMWFKKNSKHLISLPGVPYEMKGIFSDHVIDKLTKQFKLESLYHKTIQTQGIGESYLADRMEDLEEEMESLGISFAYLPSPGSVRVRLSSEKLTKNIVKIHALAFEIQKRFPQYVFGFDDDRLAEVVGKLLIDNSASLGVIESCTGGALGASIVSVPGSSSYFQGGITSYSNALKVKLVGVNEETINLHGPVSRNVVEEMSQNGREKLGADYCISISGVAGPDGGTIEKPVGTVWISITGPQRVFSKKFNFGDNRERNIKRTVLTALNLMRCELLQINIEKS